MHTHMYISKRYGNMVHYVARDVTKWQTYLPCLHSKTIIISIATTDPNKWDAHDRKGPGCGMLMIGRDLVVGCS